MNMCNDNDPLAIKKNLYLNFVEACKQCDRLSENGFKVVVGICHVIIMKGTILPGEPLLDSVEQTTANQIAYFAHVLSGGGWLSRKQKGPAKRSLTDIVVKVLLEVAVPWDCLWYDP